MALGNGCHGDFLIEIKCFFKFREESNVRECLGDLHFCLDQTPALKESHRYMNHMHIRLFSRWLRTKMKLLRLLIKI